VQAADPVDDEDNLGCCVVDIRHDLLDESADDALLQPCVGRRRRPDGLEVRRQHAERYRIDGDSGRGRIMRRDPALDLRHMRERLVPACLQFTCHQPVRRIGGIVLPKGAVGRVARRFEIAAERIAHLIPSLTRFLSRSCCRGDGAPGPTTLNSASSIASSTRKPPKAMQRGSALSIQPRLQL
jgi:hypothetical protein